MPNDLFAQRQPVPLTAVTLEGGFWGRAMETNRQVTLPIEYKQCCDTGRIDAFKLEWKPGQPNPPHIFWDSDVGKWIEAAAYSLAAHPDAAREQVVDGVIDLIAIRDNKSLPECAKRLKVPQ